MKKLLAITAMLASAAAMSGTANAAANAYGSVKLQWNVVASLNAVVHTNYTNAFAFGGGTSVDQESGAGGTCLASTTNTDLNIDFGTITPSTTVETGCNYQNAVATSVQTNDANGFKVEEYIDETNLDGAVFCAYPNQPATFGVADATTGTVAVSGRAAPLAYTASCNSGGSQVPLELGGTVNNSGVAPAQPGTITTPYTGEYVSGSTADLLWVSNTTSAPTPVIAGEDLQLNLPTTATSGSENVTMTLEYIAN